MSIEFAQLSSIKEEYSSDSEIVESDDFCIDFSTKCGEMFLDRTGEHFTFVCAFCLKSFKKLGTFGEHLHKCRALPKEEPLDKQISMKVDDVSTDLNHVDMLEVELNPEHSKEVEEMCDLKDPIKLEDIENETQNKSESPKLPDELEATQSNITETRSKTRKRSRKSQSPTSKQDTISTRKFCCYSCGKLLGTNNSLRIHYHTMHSDMIEKDTKQFEPKIPSEMLCGYCRKTFYEPNIYHFHIEFDHKDKLYSCDRCPATFQSRSKRDHHLDIHDGIKRYQCPHCPAQFANASNRARHIDIHLNNRRYTCRFCDKKYVSSSDLKIHERTHTNEKPFQCEECGRSFVSQVQLTKHQRRHKNIKRYKCTQCDKAFFGWGVLKAHIITHTNERPFSCDICQAKFRAATALRSHKMLHLDKKTFECKMCGKMFAQYAGLYSHMKSHKVLECD